MVMYQEHFGLSRPPFSMHPDPDFLYLSEQHSSAKAFLESSALVNDSFVVITGSIGAGKTTLVEGFLSELPTASTVIARINQTRLSATGFLRLLLDDLGLKAFKAKKPQLLTRLGNFLETCEREGKKVVLVVDEAQNLSRAVLEEIRLLTGSQHAACLSVVLVGQPEFLKILESPRLKQLAQRCRLRSHLVALDEEETREYIAHRLAVAGAEQAHIFSPDAIEKVFTHTGGVPRLINNLCDTALICAFADGHEVVDEEVVAAALKELNWQPDPGSGDAALAAERIENARSNKARGQESKDIKKALADLAGKTALISELESKLELALAESEANRKGKLEAESVVSQLQETGSVTNARKKTILASQQRLSDLQEEIASFLDSNPVENTDEPDSEVASLLEHFTLLESRLQESDDLLSNLEHAGNSNHKAVIDTDEKLAALQNELAESHSENEELQVELEGHRVKAKAVPELEAQLAEANSAIESLEEVNAELNNSIGDFDERLEKSDSRVRELEDTLDKQSGDNKKLTAENDKLNSKLEAQVANTESLAAELKTLESQLSTEGSDNKKLAGENEKLSGKLETQATNINTLATENETLKSELEAQLSDAKDLASDNDRLGGELEVKIKSLQDAQQHIAEQDASLLANSEEIAALTEARENLEGELESTRSRLSATEAHQKELEESSEQSAARIVRLSEKVDSRDHSIRTLETEVRRKNKLIDELHDQLKPLPELSSQVETLGAENNELRNDLESRMHRVAELEEALSLSQQRLDDARHEIDSSHSQHVGLHKEIAEHKSQVSELEKGTSQRDDLVKSLHIECQNRKQDLRRLRSELDESLDQARELRDLVKVGESRAQDLESELQAALETIREMNESGHATSTEAKEASVELTKREQQIDSLRAALQDKEETLLSMATTLKEKTETIKVLELDADSSGEHKQATGPASETGAQDQLVLQLRREVEARDRRIDDLESKSGSSSKSLAKLASLAEERDAKIRQLEEQLESSRLAAAELREEVGRTDREFDETAVLEEESAQSSDMSLRLQTLGAGLLISTNGHPARRLPLRSERLIIGRTRDSDIKIDNEFASRHHAQIIYDKGRFFVEDLNSTNGIFVNSRRVKRRRLRNRDIISIGRDKLIFVLEQHTSH